MTLRKQIKSFFSYEVFALFLMFYTSNDTLLFGTNEDSAYILIRYVVLVMLFIYGLIRKKSSRSFNQNIVVTLAILVFFFLFNSVMTGLHFGFLYNILLILTAITYSTCVSKEIFFSSYKKLFYVIAFFSIVVYFLNIISPSLTNGLPVFYNSEGMSFRFAGLAMIFDNLQMRNFGIFREPGVYMIYLNIALFCELFSERPSSKRMMVYLVAILTTISTAGVIIASLIIAFSLFFSRKYKLLFVLVPVFFLVYYSLQFMPNLSLLLFGKLQDPTGSTYARLASLTVPIDIWKDYIFGAGPDLYDKLFPIYSNSRYGLPIDSKISTNTLLKFLAVYGPFVFGFMTYFLYKFTHLVTTRRIVNLFFFIVLLISISNEDLRDSIFFYLFIAYGIQYSSIRRRNLAADREIN